MKISDALLETEKLGINDTTHSYFSSYGGVVCACALGKLYLLVNPDLKNKLHDVTDEDIDDWTEDVNKCLTKNFEDIHKYIPDIYMNVDNFIASSNDKGMTIKEIVEQLKEFGY